VKSVLQVAMNDAGSVRPISESLALMGLLHDH